MRFGNLILLTGLGLLITGSAVDAQLVSTAGGTVLFDSTNNHDDEVSGARALGFTGSFFGTPLTSVYVSTNGNLNTNASATFTNTAFPQSGNPFIAALWDDLYIFQGSGSTITENVSAGNYYAATYDVAEIINSASREQFQIVLFGNNVAINGFAFRPGDIAFAYTQVSTPFTGNDATVGLNFGDGTTAAVLPGTTNGVINDASLLPIFPTSNQFVLFRPNGNNYSASIQTLRATVTPEPGSVALLLGLATTGAGFLSRRRRQQAQNAA